MPCSKKEFVQLMDGEAGSIPCDSCSPDELELEAPPWFNKEQFTRGRMYIQQNLSSQLAASLIGLISVLSIESSLNILIRTQKSSTTLSAYRRYVSTNLHNYAWICYDLKPGSESWKSLLTVRKRHLRASIRSQERGDNQISQRDLVITLFTFFGYGFLKPKDIGLDVNNEEDLKAYLHYWRTIGFMVGIHDKYNFCDGCISEVMDKMQYIRDDILRPLLLNPPEYYYYMVKTMLDGMAYMSFLINTKLFLHFTYKMNDIPGFEMIKPETESFENGTEYSNNGLVGTENHFEKNNLANNNIDSVTKNTNVLDGNKLFKSMSDVDLASYHGMLNMFGNGPYSWLKKWILNLYFYINFFFVKYLPIVAFFHFGFKKSYVNMFAEDIAIPATLKTNQVVLEELYAKN